MSDEEMYTIYLYSRFGSATAMIAQLDLHMSQTGKALFLTLQLLREKTTAYFTKGFKHYKGRYLPL